MLLTLTQFMTFVMCGLTHDNCYPFNKEVTPEETLAGRSLSTRSDIYSDTENFIDGVDYRDSRGPIVFTRSGGGVEGYIMKTIQSRSIAAFEGIPYAKPPIGRLRFRSPEPYPAWPGIRDTKKLSYQCLQLEATQYYRVLGHEDCLFLNVYTPKLPRDGKQLNLPVIVYIHGGGHFFGSGGVYGPAYLLDSQDIILVTFNYRLGVLGYLSTGDAASPGNYALKDQALALRWVQNNIDRFGGDKTRITIMGQSAGAVGVGLHLVSHQTREIPYTAILHSGNSLGHWGIVNYTVPSTKKIAKLLRCSSTDSYKMVECLRNVNPYFLVERQMGVYKKLRLPLMPFGPVVEPPSPEAFLIESPEMAYRNKNVSTAPTLMGFVRDEGNFLVGLAYLRQWFPSFRTDEQKREMFPLIFAYEDMEPAERDGITQKLIDYYLKGVSGEINFWRREEFTKPLSDRYFINPSRKGMEWHSKVAPTYGFFVNYVGKYSTMETLGLNRQDWGVSHIDDIQYLLNSTLYFKPLKTSDEEFQISKFFTNVWGNFATKRVPVFTNEDGKDISFWKKIDKSSPEINLLDITKTPKMGKFPYEERYQFWKSLKLKNDAN